MDRACAVGLGRAFGRGGFLRVGPFLAVTVAACSTLTTDLNRVIALEVLGGATQTVEQGGSLQLMATALDGFGDPVTDATITWELVDVDSGQVGFTLAPTGLVSAIQPGAGRVQARVENLRSGPITITVVSVIPDSLAAAGDERLTLTQSETESPRMSVVVLDLTVAPPNPMPLEGQDVVFALTFPSPGSAEAQGFFVTHSDTVPGPDPYRISVRTDSVGLATAVVRRLSEGSLPDSAVIDASLESVAGSPIRFVILFESAPP